MLLELELQTPPTRTLRGKKGAKLIKVRSSFRSVSHQISASSQQMAEEAADKTHASSTNINTLHNTTRSGTPLSSGSRVIRHLAGVINGMRKYHHKHWEKLYFSTCAEELRCLSIFANFVRNSMFQLKS